MHVSGMSRYGYGQIAASWQSDPKQASTHSSPHPTPTTIGDRAESLVESMPVAGVAQW